MEHAAVEIIKMTFWIKTSGKKKKITKKTAEADIQYSEMAIKIEMWHVHTSIIRN